MNVERLAIEDVLRLTPPRYRDERGWFSETFRADRTARSGIAEEFVQDNQSFSARRGTVRGMHCQIAPHVQGKLVRVVRGAILDVAVDIRHGSPSYGRHVAAELSADNAAQLWVPGGFLHGFMTLSDDVEVIYKVTAFYDRDCERGVVWTDPDLGIDWPIAAERAIVAERDAKLPRLAACEPWFRVGAGGALA